MVSKHEYAYASGLFDGEGTVTLVGNPRRVPNLILANTELELVEVMEATFGGTIRTRRRAAGNRQEQWIWRLTKWEDCADAMTRMLPYIRSARKRARMVFLLERYPETRGKQKVAPTVELLEARMVMEDEFFDRFPTAKPTKAIRSNRDHYLAQISELQPGEMLVS